MNGESTDNVISLSDLETKIFRGIDSTEKVKFDKHDIQDQIVMGLAVSLLERCHAIVLLVQNDKVFDAEIILRSALEHMADLQNVTNDPSYCLNLQAEYLKGRRLQLQEAKDGNPFFSSIANELPVDEELNSIEEKNKEVREQGGKILTTQDKFSRAGLHSEYQSIYRSLSAQVHPTYAGILKRHFAIDHENDDFEFIGFSEPLIETVNVVVDTAGQLVDHTIRLVNEYERSS